MAADEGADSIRSAHREVTASHRHHEKSMQSGISCSKIKFVCMSHNTEKMMKIISQSKSCKKCW
jgi:hypothetical protein